jgi:hypothetical protein
MTPRACAGSRSKLKRIADSGQGASVDAHVILGATAEINLERLRENEARFVDDIRVKAEWFAGSNIRLSARQLSWLNSIVQRENISPEMSRDAR